ncbi:MAG: hypothetical protein AB1611_01570 [bacterium]
MSAKVLHIKRKLSLPPESWARFSNFRCQEGESIDPGVIISNPDISPYCLDDPGKRVIFVETSPGIDLSKAPFYYQAQFQHAIRLVAVSYEDIHSLARAMGDPFDNLILIYSVGRCGSTLLSRVFNQVPGVVSLSEPDIFTQVVGLRNPDGSRDSELSRLLRDCTRILGKPGAGGRKPNLAIKFRSFGIELGDLMHGIFPQARNIFLYRNAEDVIESLIRAFGDQGFWGRTFRAAQQSHLARFWLRLFIARRKKSMSRLIPLIQDYPSRAYKDLGSVGIALIMWLSVMHRYLDLYRRGVPMIGLRYEDLIARPHEVVKALFEYCGLPVWKVPAACRVFEHDVRLGSYLDRKPPSHRCLNLDDLLNIQRFLRSHPDVQSPHFVAPGTLTVE